MFSLKMCILNCTPSFSYLIMGMNTKGSIIYIEPI